jgi:hypothetical protein
MKTEVRKEIAFVDRSLFPEGDEKASPEANNYFY